MAGKTLQKSDFDEIKSMQNRGWKRQTIERWVFWSERTVKRVLKSPNYAAYKRLVIHETTPTKLIQKAAKKGTFKHGNEVGTYEDINKPPSITQVTLRPRSNWLRRILRKLG